MIKISLIPNLNFCLHLKKDKKWRKNNNQTFLIKINLDK